MLDKREQSSLIDIEKDIINHPLSDDNLQENNYLQKIFDEEVFSKAEIEEINSALRIILKHDESNKDDIIDNLWKVNFKRKIPTPEEFLTEKYIGATALSLYPHVKKTFIDYFDISKSYRTLVEYWPIGSGKSVLVSLCKAYLSYIDYYLRDTKKFFKLSPTTHIVDGTVSINLDMAFDLNIRPLLNILDSSTDTWCRVKQEAQLLKAQKEDLSKVYYTTAVKGNALMRIGDLHFHTISDPTQLLGLSLQSVSMTELAFMSEKGMKQETIMRLLNDSKERLYSRFGGHFYSRLIIDSSPNDLDNLVDRYIMYDSIKDPSVLRVMGRKWELQPQLFPIWEKTKETFPMFKGNASKPSKVIENYEKENYDVNETIDVPIDIKQLAIDSPNSVMKNYGGFPSGSDLKLISNADSIERVFTTSLKSIYTFEHAPSSLPPEGLLWNIIKKQFFNYTGQGQQYEFYRNPYAERFISIDLAKKHDMAAIAMSHLESNTKGEKVYVVDFALPILSTKEEINLDSFKFLIIDMIKYGGMVINKVSFDQFQSDSSRQFLLRNGIDVINLSVDRTMEPYMSFISYMNQNRIKMGRNLVMKNNLKSLILIKQLTKMKIEHEQGEWCDLQNLDWENSRMGYFGKDLSDAVVASINLCDSYGTFSGDYTYSEEIENKRIQKSGINIALENLEKEFNLTIK